MIKEDDKSCKPEIHLIFANKTEKDLVLIKELELMKTKLNLKIHYFLEEINQEQELNIHFLKNNEINKGLISREFLEENFSKYADKEDFLIMACGSKKMTKEYLSSILLKLNFKEENIFIY